jgi:preprotein translocase subunit SecG
VTALILTFQIISSLLLILFILLHAGRGGGLSEMFGGGMSSAGGSTVVEKNLDRITVVTALVFIISTVALHFRIR